MSTWSATLTQEDVRYLANLCRDWETARKCRDICLQAKQQFKEDTAVIDKTAPLRVPDSITPNYGKNREYENRVGSIGGHLSDESIRRLAGDYLQMSFQEPREGLSSPHQDAPFDPDGPNKFKVDPQAYDQLKTGSSNPTFPVDKQTDPGTRPTRIDKSATTTTYRLLWTCVSHFLHLEDLI